MGANADIMFGAIRWDATFCPLGTGAPVVRSLSPQEFQFRAPARATVRGTRAISWTATQSDMDTEIAEAISGGLSHWVFLRYTTGASNSDLNNGFTLYQSSVNRSTLKWASMTQASDMGTTGSYSTRVAELVAEFGQAHYLKVLTNRPLFYIYDPAGSLASRWGGSLVNFKAMVDALRAATISAGMGTPYVVCMSSIDAATATGIGADAVSNYGSTIPATLAGPYTGLAASAASYWALLAASYAKIVPICMAGWDRRPRIEHPVSYEYSTQRAFIGNKRYTVTATPAEVAAHVTAAIAYIRANPTVCDSKAIMIYAWNEIDEGGWLQKTIGDPTGLRLAALAPVLA